MAVAPEPEHGRAYKLTVVPVRASASGLGHAWRSLIRVDARWREHRQTAPFPLFRWSAGIGLLIWIATSGTPTSFSGWFLAHLPWLIVAGALTVAPEIVRIEFGGMKMELLREARAEVRTLTQQVNQLQIQQAAAASSASAGVNQTFMGMAALTEVAAATQQGEETQAVPAQDINWANYSRLTRGRTFGPPGTTAPSMDPGAGSTVEE